ncbi:MAG: S8 family serine peptidase [Muribaculaceae bacterium]|nr:S8 family serine peptidase [Muribaculaceae bacterium]
MKRNLLLFALLLLVLGMRAQFSARTLLTLGKELPAGRSVAAAAPGDVISCFVEIDDPAVLASLAAMGVTVEARFGTMATARMRREVLSRLAGLPGLRRVALAQPLELTNDSARLEGHVDAIHLGEELPQAYKGRGVIIGLIDSGVDFNHINFLDRQGRNRISRVYMPQDTTGTPPVLDGDTLPGSHYDTQAQIAALTTDTPKMWHGSHTLGTAAGSRTQHGYQGVAPEAELVVCAMPTLYDTDIANAIRYIMDYAQSVRLPVVVSMSFASQEGAHNGTSPLCRLFDQLSGPGRIFLISAGNSARQRVYLEHRFKDARTDTLRTYFDNYNASSKYSGYVSLWSANAVGHRLALTLVDRTSRRQLAAVPLMPGTDDLATCCLDSISELAPYFTGEAASVSLLDDNGQFHSVFEIDATPLAGDRYRLGLQVVADSASLMRAWSSGVIMINDAGVPGYTAASRVSTINDLATGDQAISVGAYCTRATVPTADGGTRTVARSTPGDIAYFSSYGPDARGIARPEVCAPGMALVSSGSRFYADWSAASLIDEDGGVQYPYFAMSGTSMSTPFTAGTVALWLQANPHLTPGDVRQVLQNTAVRDSCVTANPHIWGFGKLDAQAGLRYVLEHYVLEGDFNSDGVVDVDDLNLLINVILRRQQDPAIETQADLDGSGTVDVADLNLLINIIIGKH